MNNLLILASGSGTNAENIIQSFSSNEQINVSMIGSNRKDAFVLQRAKNHHIPSFIFSKDELQSPELGNKWEEHSIDYIILAGFLLKIPQWIIEEFPDRIINIHPALLPKHGGKGMYGQHVHQAVKDQGDPFTGITIHLVNEQYDEGKILFQGSVSVDSADSIEQIAAKVHALEYQYFPEIIADYIAANKA